MKRLMVSLVVVLVMAGVVSVCEAVPVRWEIADGGNGHWYDRIDVPSGISWSNAKTSAEGMSYLGVPMYLATITSGPENDLIKEYFLEDAPHVRYWLGGFQPGSHSGGGWPEPGDNWQWITTGEDWEYTNWVSWEPSNSGGGPLGHEDALQIYSKPSEPIKHGKWNDSPHEGANYAEGFIVEVPGPAEPVEVKMVLIPGGEFEMGDHFSEGSSDELPVHTVILDSFYIDKYEITNQEYCVYLNSVIGQNEIEVRNGVVYAAPGGTDPYCDTHSADGDSQVDYSGGVFSVISKGGRDMSDDPMVEVSWYGAKAFCDYYGYRLPTEAEWEYAARGGLSGKRFPWSDHNITHSRANYNADVDYAYDLSYPNGLHPLWNSFYPYTSPVGFFDGTMKYKGDYNWPGSDTSYQTTSGANGYGLYDMAGNVFEWCNDWYDSSYYSVSPYDNPQGPVSGTGRVLRGGAWDDDAYYCRVANRYDFHPDFRDSHGGFRVARDVEPVCDPDQEGIWEPMDSGTTNRLSAVWGTAPENIFAVGDIGTILHFNGNNWTQMVSPTTNILRDVWGAGPSDVYAVGDEYTVVHYDGDSWVQVSGLPTCNISNLNGVWGSGPNDIFAVGEGHDSKGHVIHWDGNSWSEILPPFQGPLGSTALFEIWGRGPNDVYVSGYNGYSSGTTGLMYHYDGSSWELFHPDGLGDHDLPKTRAISSIWGSADSAELFLVGQSFGGPSDWFAEAVLYNGSEWVTEIFQDSHTLNSVWESAHDNVYMVGHDGKILHYDGTDWTSMNSGTTEDLLGIWGNGPGDIFIVGKNGTILHLSEPTCEPVNTVPDADAGDDQTCGTGPGGEADVTLDCSGSNDPDGDELTYTWYLDGEVIATGCNPVIELPCGTYTLELIVNDGTVDSEPDYVTITVEDNTSPVITCPTDTTIECSESTDPANTGTASATDNCDDGPVVGYSDSVSGSCPTIITRMWTATDESGNSDSCDQIITVQDTTPPVISCPADVVLECPADTSVAANGSATAADNCDDWPVITYEDEVIPGVGNNETIIRLWTATDACGNSSSCEQIIVVEDTIAPELSVSVEPGVLWPPNHKMVEISSLISASDSCDDSPTYILKSITMNEGEETNTYDPGYDDTLGDGNTIDDIQVDADGTIYLRAERSGTGDGRVYTITYEAEDASGNTSEATATVTVPHNQP